MCIPLNILFGGWERAPLSHHHQHNHSKEDDCIADCLCCPCNLLCYLLLAIEEFLSCWEFLDCFDGGELNYPPGSTGRSQQTSVHRSCSYHSLPGTSGPSVPTLHLSKSAPACFGGSLDGGPGGGRGLSSPSSSFRSRRAELKRSSSLRYAPGFHEIEHHCWECERRRHG